MRPLSAAGDRWMGSNPEADEKKSVYAPNGALIVESRFLDDIIEHAEAEGLVIARVWYELPVHSGAPRATKQSRPGERSAA